MPYTEDHLVQRTTAEFLDKTLGWESVYAYNNEDFGPDSLLGRSSDSEVVLTRYLRLKLETFNPGLPPEAYESAIRQLLEYSTAQSLVQINQEKDALLRDGIKVSFQNDNGKQETRRLRVFDFDNPENNHFLIVRELWVKGSLYRRRADLVCFVNGIPLIFVEAKNTNKDVRAAYDQNFSDCKDTVPHLFHHNAIVVLTNGIEAKIGSLTSPYEHFHEWKRLEEEDPGVVDLETLLRGVAPYDISRIDFDLLQREFRKVETPNTTVQSLKHAIEQRLDRMMRRNPLRMDFQNRIERTSSGPMNRMDKLFGQNAVGVRRGVLLRIGTHQF